MPHSHHSIKIHYIFSTKYRELLLTSEVQPRLWPFLGGIARENGMTAIKVGGVEDHVHALIALPTTMSVAKGVQLLKAGSSKWIHEEFHPKGFAWQEGYGAFSVSESHVRDTIRYIERQAEHHRKVSFEEEFRGFLRKHGIDDSDWDK